jgi:hypothetical protein
MEPERPKIDRAIIEFLKSENLHPADFVIRSDGVVRLNPGWRGMSLRWLRNGETETWQRRRNSSRGFVS